MAQVNHTIRVEVDTREIDEAAERFESAVGSARVRLWLPAVAGLVSGLVASLAIRLIG